jgi:pyruvate ferredoxin oxidoreductase gamma subunit
MPANAVVVVNSDLPPVGLRRKYGLKQFRLYSVPATAIARETTNPPVPTSAMLGAVARVTGLFPVESVIEVVPEDFGKRFGPGVVEGNANAVVRSYEEARGE